MNYIKRKVTTTTIFILFKVLFLLFVVTLNIYIVFSYVKVINPHGTETTANSSLSLSAKSEISALGVVKILLKFGVPRKHGIVYILLWTYSGSGIPRTFEKNYECFVNRNCTFNNCFVTYIRDYLGDYTRFDVILFIGPHLDINDLPEKRSPRQIYVYGNVEPDANYPVCDKLYDNFFNWTWTYRLDSTLRWGYVTVRDMKGSIIGPKQEMHWIRHKDMQPVKESFKLLLNTKTKAVVWFVSNCHTSSQREFLARKLENELKSFNLTLDIFGKCGKMVCLPNRGNICNEVIERDYYFYLSFENALSEDYVTEKILYPLQFNAIPIVFGGANYTRFIPDGAYLNANQMGVKKIAALINRLVHNKEEYYEYFRWKNHYQYFGKDENPETDDYCEFCAALNNKKLVKKIITQNNFTDWWSSSTNACLSYIPPRKKLETDDITDDIFVRLGKVYCLSLLTFIILRLLTILSYKKRCDKLLAC